MGRFWKWLWAEKRKRRGIVFFGVIFFFVGSVISVEVTSTPHFCSSCHIMETYYESWENSAHHDVSCVKCHIEPGATSFIHAKLNGLGQVVDDVLSRTSTKPSASVTALSCTRSGCHSVSTLEGKQISNDIFKFRHDMHLGKVHLGVEIACGTCHSHVMGDEHFEVNTSVCITCHMIESVNGGVDYSEASAGGLLPGAIHLAVRDGFTREQLDANGHTDLPPSSCTTCHDAPTEIIEFQGLTVDHREFLSHGASCESCHRDATASPQPIEDGRCVSCHTYGIEKTLPVEEMHRVHALGKHKIECFSCHGMVRHGISAQTMSLEQFECQQCHLNQHSVQRDAYLQTPDLAHPGDASSIESAINPMFMAHVACTGCHVSESTKNDNAADQSRIVTASAESCDRCHKPGMGEQMIPLWQSTTRKLFDQVEAKLESLRDANLSDSGKAQISEAEQLLDLIRIDGSWGVHNPTYTQQLLERALDRVKQAEEGSVTEEG